MHNVCYLTAQPWSSFLSKKNALGLARCKKKAHGSLLNQDLSTGKQFFLCWFCSCQPRSGVYLVSSFSALHSLVQYSVAHSPAEQCLLTEASCFGLKEFPGKVRVLSSDRQGSKPFFPGEPNPRNHLLLPWSLSICDSGFQRTLGSQLLRSHDPHLTFLLKKQTKPHCL